MKQTEQKFTLTYYEGERGEERSVWVTKQCFGKELG